MTFPFAILALITLISAVAAMSLRNLVHCALCLVATFAGLAGLYLQLNAEFVGLVQVLVYVGAVAILIVFAILLTRNSDVAAGEKSGPGSPWIGLAVAGLVAGCLVTVVLSGAKELNAAQPSAEATASASVRVKQIGSELMSNYVLPLEVIGLLLTAALIGAVIIAMQTKESK